MSSIVNQSTNPEKLPVEKLTLEVKDDGVVQKIKALDPYWVEEKGFVPFESPLNGEEFGQADIASWISAMEIYREDLKWLLCLKHHIFWSTVIHNPTVITSLVSFLQEAKPPYLPDTDIEEIFNLYIDIRRYVLIVYSRLITNKESQYEWMSKDYMARVLYDKFIFTVPVLWDICLQYGTDNGQHVRRLVSSVYGLQPQYETDTEKALAFVAQAFKYITKQVNADYDTNEPLNLPKTFKGFSEIRRPDGSSQMDSLPEDALRDLVVHLVDTSMTLRLFAEAYPKSVWIFRRANFITSIVQLYEHGLPYFYKKLETVDSSVIDPAQIEEYVDIARDELIELFKEILATHKNAILSGDGDISAHVEEYLQVMMDVLTERLFIRDYQANYPAHEDLEMMQQVYPDIDPVKTNFIQQALYTNLEDIKNASDDDDESDTTSSDDDDQSEEGACALRQSPSAADIISDAVIKESLIQEVRDVMPDLGGGFILKCLEYYGFSSSKVVNCLLEDNLAESLRGLDRSLPIIPEDPVDKKFLETGVQRLNVFDGDEFDIMTRDDVDVSRIHIGKKQSKYRDISDMLDDKSDLKKRMDIYQKYSVVYDEEELYDDEYDDTCEVDELVPVADTTADDRRPLVTPRVLRNGEDSQTKYSYSSSSEEEVATDGQRNKLDFCHDPAEARARREAAYRARRGRGGKPPQQKPQNVTGKPRGQGQEKDVVVSRDKKEKNKSARANHNRRQGATWKRSQGMMPS